MTAPAATAAAHSPEPPRQASGSVVAGVLTTASPPVRVARRRSVPLTRLCRRRETPLPGHRTLPTLTLALTPLPALALTLTPPPRTLLPTTRKRPTGRVQRRLLGTPRLLPAPLLGRDALPAMRTRVVLAQPRADAVAVEPMLARQHRHLVADVDAVHAHAALGLARVVEHGLVDGDFRQRGDRGGRRGSRRGRAAVLVHQLRYHAVEGFLAVDGVAVLGVGGIEHAREQGWKAGGAGGAVGPEDGG